MFFPKEYKFFDLFEAQTEKLNEAALLFKKLIAEPDKIEEIAKEMKKLEHEADEIGHETASHLRKSFITPIEREDIDILRQNLDDIMDDIERAVNRIQIYNIKTDFFEKINGYVEIIAEAVKEIKEGIQEIKNLKKFSSSLLARCEKINKLENEGDDLNRTTLKKLMATEIISQPEDILEIIKQKEIFETLENAIDRCEDVANIFEAILIKNT